MTERESLCAFLWRLSKRPACNTEVADYANKRQPLSWPSAVLLCVRQPLDHHALLLPFENFPVGYPNIFGPPRTGPRCVDCGALLYVAAARVVAFG